MADDTRNSYGRMQHQLHKYTNKIIVAGKPVSGARVAPYQAPCPLSKKNKLNGSFVSHKDVSKEPTSIRNHTGEKRSHSNALTNEVCKHCNQTFTTNSELVAHLLDVVNSNSKQLEKNSPGKETNASTDEDTADPRGLLKPRKMRKKQSYRRPEKDDQDEYTTSDSGTENEEHLHAKSPLTSNKSYTTSLDLKCKITIKDGKYTKCTLNECFDSTSTQSSENNVGAPTIQRKEVKLFKCLCGIHFISYKSIQKHFLVCRPTNKIFTQTCIKCGYLFERDAITKHVLKHHPKEQYAFKIHLMTPDMRNIYKCGSCEVLFYVKEDLTKHFVKCNPYDSDQRSYFISECSKFTASGYNIVTVANPNVATGVDDEIESDCEVPKCHSTKTDNMNGEDYAALKLQSSSKLKNLINPNRAAADKKATTEDDEKKTIYKCVKCDIHYLTVQSIKYHFDMKHVNISRVVTCTTCGLKFPSITMKRHIAIQHNELNYQLKDFLFIELKSLDCINRIKYSQKKFQLGDNNVNLASPKQTDKTVTSVDDEKKTLYKCFKCDIHYLTLETIRYHFHENHVNQSKVLTCTTCGLKFPSITMRKHIALQHNELKYQLKDLLLIQVNSIDCINTIKYSQKKVQLGDNNDNLASPKQTDKTATSVDDEKKTLYKCVKCDIHYLTVEGIKYHFNVNHVNKSRVATCTACGLKFPAITMKRHISLQHNVLKYRLKDFLFIQLKSIDCINTMQWSQKKL